MKVKISTLRRIIKEEIGNLPKGKSLNESFMKFSSRTEYLKDYLSGVGVDSNVPATPATNFSSQTAVENVLDLLREAASAANNIDPGDPTAAGTGANDIALALRNVWSAAGLNEID